MTSDTIFHIASLTKSFTAACIYQLRADNRLSLDDLIQKHLPEAKSRDPLVAATATVADLLGHRTGLQKADDIWLGSDGELHFNRDQTSAVFSYLLPQASLRSRFLYNNIGYAILGEIIMRLTGQPYHIYLKESILDPLNMTRTLVTKDSGLPDDVSLAYSTLDTGEPYNVPLLGNSASVAMGAAGGLLSTANDLAKFYKTLMGSWRNLARGGKDSFESEGKKSVLGNVSWLLAPLQIMETPTLREQSYAAGWAISQLPAAVGSLGANTGLVDKMPLLGDGTTSQMALWHQGSLVGATFFVMLLPETESAVLVLTNTMAPNDAADWMGQLLVETVIESPVHHDYVHLASVSADRALERYAELSEKVEGGRKAGGPDRILSDYVGVYVGFAGIFRIEVVLGENGLEMLFQARESQKYQLQHHHHDTFTWFTSWNEQIKRARFLDFRPAFYSIRFESEEGKGVITLNWIHDSARPEGENFIKV